MKAKKESAAKLNRIEKSIKYEVTRLDGIAEEIDRVEVSLRLQYTELLVRLEAMESKHRSVTQLVNDFALKVNAIPTRASKSKLTEISAIVHDIQRRVSKLEVRKP